jgi:hypothetical protein
MSNVEADQDTAMVDWCHNVTFFCFRPRYQVGRVAYYHSRNTASYLTFYTPIIMSLLRSQILRTALRTPAASRPAAPAFARAASGYSSVPEPQNPLKSFQPDESTPKAQQQSPNVPTTWSTSQNPKPHVQNNARSVDVRVGLLYRLRG